MTDHASASHRPPLPREVPAQPAHRMDAIAAKVIRVRPAYTVPLALLLTIGLVSTLSLGNASKPTNFSSQTVPSVQTRTGTVKVATTADTYATKSTPTAHMGKATKLRASSAKKSAKRIYLQFSVTGVPAGATHVSAQLRLTRSSTLPSSTVSAMAVHSSISESRLSWRNRPSVGRKLGSAQVGSRSSSVTIGLGSAVSGNGSVSLAVTDSSQTAANFRSREAGSGPQLIVSYEITTTTTTTTVPPTTTTTTKPPTTTTTTTATTPPATATTTTAPSGSGNCTVSSILVPSCGVWWGVSPGVGSSRSAGVTEFEQETNTRVDLYHGYHNGSGLFPTKDEIGIANRPGHHTLLLENWKPEGGHTWAQVADGAVDSTIDHEAAYLKSNFTQKFFLIIHHEPEDEVNLNASSGKTPADFAAMFRHVESRLKADGVSNIVYVFDVQGAYTYDKNSWFLDLYPGSSYVDWVAWDPYACISGHPCQDFSFLMNKTYGSGGGKNGWTGFYNLATKNFPGKPLMLAEWGAFINGDAGRRNDFFNSVSSELGHFPMLKAMAYWNSTSGPRGNTSIKTSDGSAQALGKAGTSSWFTAESVP